MPPQGLILSLSFLLPILADRKIIISFPPWTLNIATHQLLTRLDASRPDGNATVNSPPAGFSQMGLAALFNSSGLTISSQNPPILSHSNRTALIAGSIAGVITFFVLLFTALYACRNVFRRHLLRSSPDSRVELGGECSVEIDGTSKQEMEASTNEILEIMDADVTCELPAGEVTESKRERSRGENGDEDDHRDDHTDENSNARMQM